MFGNTMLYKRTREGVEFQEQHEQHFNGHSALQPIEPQPKNEARSSFYCRYRVQFGILSKVRTSFNSSRRLIKSLIAFQECRPKFWR